MGVIRHSMANFFFRSSPKRGKVKISLHVDCHEVNTFGGTEIVAEFGAAVIRWVTNWGTEMLLFYADSSVATGRATLAGQVEGEHPDKERYTGPPGWGLGVGRAASVCTL